MDLDEYLWRNRRKIKEFSVKVGCTEPTISKIRYHRGSPNLVTALKIQNETDGQVSLKELLSNKHKELIEKWMEEKRGFQV